MLRRTLVSSVALILLAPSGLFAHPRLVRSSPGAGELLSSPPSRITLIFSESPMLAVSTIDLADASSIPLRLGPVHAIPGERHAAMAAILSSLDSGRYVVRWSAAASDGHVVRGKFSFFVITPRTAPATPLPSQSGPPAAPASVSSAAESDSVDLVFSPVGYPLMLGRWLGFLSVFSVIGAVAFKYAILRRLRLETEAAAQFGHIASVGAATFGMIAAAGLVIATVIKLYGETVAMHDAPIRTILFATGWGLAWDVQLLGSLIAIAAFRSAHNESGAAWAVAAAAAFVLGVTPALTGHAIAGDEALFAVPLDVLHVIAGSVWVGTLATILVVGIGAAAKTPASVKLSTIVAGMINVFSPLALICGAIVVATGGIAALLHLEPLSTLWTTLYGQVLLIKLVVVGILSAVGAWNWRKVKPTLVGDEGVIPLQRSARLELAVSAMVLAITAFLVALPLPD